MANNREKIEAKCRICGQSGNFDLYKIKEMYYGSGDEFDYYKCSYCGCLQIKEFLSVDDLNKYYNSSYYSLSQDKLNYFNSSFKKFLVRKIVNYAIYKKGLFGRIFYYLSPQLNLTALRKIKINKNSSILDIGCGIGFDLACLNEVGFKNLLGADKYLEKDILYENGLKILKTDLNGVEGEFDVVLAFDVLEHLDNQEEFIKEVYNKLNKNGVCILSIPMIPSYEWDKYQENMFDLHVPFHFFIHTRKSLEILLAKVGFRVDEEKNCCKQNPVCLAASESVVNGICFVKSGLDKYYLSDQGIVDLLWHRLFSLRKFKKIANKINKDKTSAAAIFYLFKKK
ncbi:MAG: class I SAM-dependent methyltransferase [Candidatus Magasanikiibacteriota bacterium]